MIRQWSSGDSPSFDPGIRGEIKKKCISPFTKEASTFMIRQNASALKGALRPGRRAGKEGLMEVTVKDMMEARDRRAETQRQLLDEYGQTLLCFTMNVPGPEKYSPLIREGFALGQEMLRRSLARAGIEPLYQAARFSITGCEGFYALPMPPLEAKRLSVDIEESSSLGRLFDMDVLRPDGAKVEREVVGLPPRRCMICGKATSACARSRATP